jgi:hypothetical protein
MKVRIHSSFFQWAHEYHREESDMADDIYEDANEVDENANITNKGADEGEDGQGAMNDGGNDSFLFLSMGSHSLPEPEDNEANVEAGNLGSSLRKKIQHTNFNRLQNSLTNNHLTKMIGWPFSS